MIRKTVMAVLILLTAFLQCFLFQSFEIASIKPNLLVILTVSFGLMRGKKSGLLVGFFSGLTLDLIVPGQIGLQALIYMWIGYLAGFTYRIFYDDDIKTPLLFVCLGDLIYNMYIFVFTFMLRGRIHFFYYLRRIMIPELLYTLIITIVIYRFFYWVNRQLTKTDKRSIDSLV